MTSSGDFSRKRGSPKIRVEDPKTSIAARHSRPPPIWGRGAGPASARLVNPAHLGAVPAHDRRNANCTKILIIKALIHCVAVEWTPWPSRRRSKRFNANLWFARRRRVQT